MSDDRRELLEAALEQSEEGTLETPVEKEIEANDDPIQSSSEKSSEESSNRDTKGRFKSKSEETSSQDDSVEEPELVAETTDEPVEEVKRPTTWKKEYVDVWEKMKGGKPLNEQEFVKFAEYANQREAEYKKGVSAYKAEADRTRSYENAIAPYAQDLQKRGIEPTQYIQNLVRAEQLLSNAPYEQKVQVFQKLASDYGIQLNGGQITQFDPYTQQLMNQLNQVNYEVSSIKGRFAEEENQRLMGEIERVRSNVDKFPHFEMVREDMAQLLERGLAQDLETAYAKAVRMNDEAYKLEQDKLLRSANTQASKAQQVAKAKATAVSPRSVTPSGQVSKSDAKDRRSLLMANLADAEGGRV
jgi:hypothetical protein